MYLLFIDSQISYPGLIFFFSTVAEVHKGVGNKRFGKHDFVQAVYFYGRNQCEQPGWRTKRQALPQQGDRTLLCG